MSRSRFFLAILLGVWGMEGVLRPQMQAYAQPQEQQADHTRSTKPANPRKTRHYFIAAEPELWDFVPEGRDVICGKTLPPTLGANRTVMKLRYVAYTDATFTTKAMQEPGLGILGPVLRGVVGDSLVVTFLNRTSSSLSMHPHGVKYDKASEGSFYLPNPGAGGSVPPNSSFTYAWLLDENSGPLPSEPSSKAWLYHSHVQGDQEINQGLIGVIIVTDPRRARPDDTPSDVDRELATLFMIFDESPLAAEEKEAAEYGAAGTPKKSWAQVQQLIEEGSRYAINGRAYGNLTGLEMNEGERVRWYLFALGSERDLHSAHWHGLRVLEEGRRTTDVIELLPGSMKVADFRADNPGSWLFHCHVSEHMAEGMFARMVVHPRGLMTRKPAETPRFFGLPQNLVSIQMQGVETSSPQSGRPFEIKLQGVFTVHDAFSVFAQPIRIQLGEESIAVTPDKTGSASANAASFRVVTPLKFGVVYGGLLAFEITLQGPAWVAELEKRSRSGSKSSTPLSVPFQLDVGKSHHSTTVQITGLW